MQPYFQWATPDELPLRPHLRPFRCPSCRQRIATFVVRPGGWLVWRLLAALVGRPCGERVVPADCDYCDIRVHCHVPARPDQRVVPVEI